MSGLPTPADVPAGHVVRVRIPGQTYSSPVMPARDAQIRFATVRQEVTDAGHGDRMIGFETVDGRVVSIRARLISAVEVGPPPPLRDKPSGDVQVHLHLTPTAEDGEPFLGLSTARVLELAARSRSTFDPTRFATRLPGVDL